MTDHANRIHAEAIRSLTERRKRFTGTTRRTEPNRRLQIAAKLLLDHGAREVTDALNSINEDLNAIGYPNGGTSSRRPAYTDPAGEDAMRAANLIDDRKCIHDLIHEVETAVNEAIRFAAIKARKPIPKASDVMLCGEGQITKDGHTEWGHPGCTEVPVTKGLCAREYAAERRWRQTHGLPDRAEPAA